MPSTHRVVQSLGHGSGDAPTGCTRQGVAGGLGRLYGTLSRRGNDVVCRSLENDVVGQLHIATLFEFFEQPIVVPHPARRGPAAVFLPL
jgi:hypothetical protein